MHKKIKDIQGIFRGFLSCIWLYFPSILFLVLTWYCFWKLPQGQDIMTAFAERGKERYRVFFFLDLGLWIHLNWLGSRIIGYIKGIQSGDPLSAKAGVRPDWDMFWGQPVAWFRIIYPLVATYAGFAIIELAIIQLPSFQERPLLPKQFLWIGLAVVVISLVLHSFVAGLMEKDRQRWFDNKLYVLIPLLLIPLGFISFMGAHTKDRLDWMLAGVILMHVFFMFYINRHRFVVSKKIKSAYKTRIADQVDRARDFFVIDPSERAHFVGLVLVAFLCLVTYFVAFLQFGVAQLLGPLTIIFLGFSFLLALAYVITAFSVKWRINLHFIIIVLAIILPNIRQVHDVHRIPIAGDNGYTARPDLDKYLRSWLKRVPDTGIYDVWFVMADGGASRSGYWTACVLGKLQDISLVKNPNDPFSNHIFSLCGASGGEVGLTAFYTFLKDAGSSKKPVYLHSAESFLRKDYFSFVAARLLGPDYFHYVFPFNFITTYDRAEGLERVFERDSTDEVLNPHFDAPFSSLMAMNGNDAVLPLLFINTTRMQDGNPGVITNLKINDTIFGPRLDVLDSLQGKTDISIATAAILGARFPYVCPAGNLYGNYFVDGGYFDNSGGGATQELIHGILSLYKHKCSKDQPGFIGDTIYCHIPRLRFNVLHITNSPIVVQKKKDRVPDLSNDLFAPFVTLIGSYDEQTAVNDNRLITYLEDLKLDNFASKYYRVSLYVDPAMDSLDKKGQRFGRDSTYSMNWFMSDTTRHRINNRLAGQPVLNGILQAKYK